MEPADLSNARAYLFGMHERPIQGDALDKLARVPAPDPTLSAICRDSTAPIF